MKRRSPFLFAAAVMILAAPLVAHAGEGAWFDLENCSMCKNMSAEKGLMEHMEWETHLITNGMLSVTVVDPEYKEAFDRSMQNMKKTGEKLMAGEQMHLCGFCTSYGGLRMAGATFDYVETDAGHIDLVTSSDPKVVEMIRKHGQRTIDEYEKMMKEEHEGHSHKDHS